MIVKDSRPRPREVSIALLLLAVMWVAETAFLVWRLFISPLMVNGWEISWQAALIVFVLSVGVTGGLLAALACRRRWAYVATIILYASSLISSVGSSGLRQSFDDGPLMVLWWIAPFAAYVAAVVLLLRRPGREWYGFVRRLR